MEQAVAGLIRTSLRVKNEEARLTTEHFRISRKLVSELRFDEAQAYIDKGSTPDSQLAAAEELRQLLSRRYRATTQLLLFLRSITLPVFGGLAFLVIALLLRWVALLGKKSAVRPLEESGSADAGRTFAELVEAVAYRLRHRPPAAATGLSSFMPGSASSFPIVLVDRTRELPEVSAKVGVFEVKNFAKALIAFVWPSRFLLDGVVVSAGSFQLAEVRLKRRRVLGPSRLLLRWSFEYPAEPREHNVAAIRASAYRVLYALMQRAS